MKNLRFVSIKGDLEAKDKEILVKGMLSHHASQGHLRKTEMFSIALKNEDNEFMGGIIVSFLWNGMEILSLWVDRRIRKQGWGRKLMQAVEKEAIKRGCTFAYTNTFSWQAPEFYKELGYVLYGKLDNFPKGNFLSYFKKNLV